MGHSRLGRGALVDLSWGILGETLGAQGVAGAAAFLAAVLVAATAEAPDADCGNEVCEV